MNKPVLVVATATRWYGTARMHRIIAKARFEVSLPGPSGTPPEVVDRLHREAPRIVRLPDVRARFVGPGAFVRAPAVAMRPQ